MKKSIKKNKTFMGTFGEVEVIDNFLPSPEELVLKKEPETVKVTLALEKTSVDYFKLEAKKLGGSYQRMIRNLVSEYTNKFS